MARTPGSESSLRLLLLAVLPAGVWAASSDCGRGDSHSPHYDFNISYHEPTWCMVQGKVDEEKYLSYDCGSDKVISMNILREAGTAMDSCKHELDTLSNMGDKLKSLVPDIKQEKYSGGAPFTLQVRMTCQGKADGSPCGFLEFFLDGQRFLTFDNKTAKCRADNSLGERLKNKWQNNKKLTKFFNMILSGDCNLLHQCWVHWKTEPETTAPSPTVPATVPSKATTNTSIAWSYPVTTIFGYLAAPITVPAPATTTPTTASASPTKTTNGLETWVIILIVFIIVFIPIICIICYICRKRCCSKTSGSVV